jgi:hypothetical protein
MTEQRPQISSMRERMSRAEPKANEVGLAAVASVVPKFDAPMSENEETEVRRTAERMKAEAEQGHADVIAMRGQARRDAATMVARAIKRRGDDPTNWSVADADAAHVIADLLVRLQGQEPSPLDPAFAQRDDRLAEVAALTSALDMAARTRLAPSEPALTAPPTAPEEASELPEPPEPPATA